MKAAEVPLGLTPARIDWQAQGPFAPDFGDGYSSRAGAIGQAQAVFLAGNGIPQAWQGWPHYTVLETGFGGGTNFLATLDAFAADPLAPSRLHYLACEAHPWTTEDLHRLHQDGPFARWLPALCAQWPLPIRGWHRIHLLGGRVCLTLMWGDAEAQLAQLSAPFNAWFLDGFAPQRNPAMWGDGLINAASCWAAPGARLATWCVAGSVRRSLAAAGWQLQTRPGYGGKRESLGGQWPGTATPPSPPPKAVRVVGAGLAGSMVAHALAQRGVAVRLVDLALPPAGASAQQRMVLRPWLTHDHGPIPRLTHAGYQFALTHPAIAPHLWRCGVLLQPRTVRDAPRQLRLLQQQGIPSAMAVHLGTEDASAQMGLEVVEGGLFYRNAGVIDPLACIAAATTHTAIDLAVGGLVDDNVPTVLATAGAVDATCPALQLDLIAVRGQSTHLPAGSLPALRGVASREASVIPLPGGAAIVAATYTHERHPTLDMDSQQHNLAQLARVLATPLPVPPLAGQVGFRAVTRDRLPLLGEVAPGLWMAAAYASRGAVWAPLLGEVLACLICGEPPPIEADLLRALHPRRFVRAQATSAPQAQAIDAGHWR